MTDSSPSRHLWVQQGQYAYCRRCRTRIEFASPFAGALPCFEYPSPGAGAEAPVFRVRGPLHDPELVPATPLATAAPTRPASVHPPSNQPSSARGEGTPSNVPACATCETSDSVCAGNTVGVWCCLVSAGGCGAVFRVLEPPLPDLVGTSPATSAFARKYGPSRRSR
jgi:hypothetical protein